MDQVEQDTSGFTPLYACIQASGVVLVVLTGVWLGRFRDGFAWSSIPSIQFNWHPILMITGLIYLYGSAILIYRVFRNEHKYRLKCIHAALLITALICAIVGLIAVFDSHNYASPPIPNLYSLHSWIGLTVVILFGFQWLVGFLTFLAPGLASHLRAKLLPFHVNCGIIIFIGAVMAALTGLTEKAIFSISSDYSKKTFEGQLVNWIGIFVMLFAFLVCCAVRNDRFRRLARPDDEILQHNRLSD